MPGKRRLYIFTVNLFLRQICIDPGTQLHAAGPTWWK